MAAGAVTVRAPALNRTQMVGGGDPFTATVTLTRPASADTTVYPYGSACGPVQLTPTVTIYGRAGGRDREPARTVPATVTIPAGATSVSFPVVAGSGSSGASTRWRT